VQHEAQRLSRPHLIRPFGVPAPSDAISPHPSSHLTTPQVREARRLGLPILLVHELDRSLGGCGALLDLTRLDWARLAQSLGGCRALLRLALLDLT
jgi:hypothetical protein